MSKHVLIIDCGCENYGRGGSLNHYLSNIADEELQKLGYSTEITLVDSEWEPAAEAEKFKRADFVIVQTPGWWMSTPWRLNAIWILSGCNPALRTETAAITKLRPRATAPAVF